MSFFRQLTTLIFILVFFTGCDNRPPLQQLEKYGTQSFNLTQWQQRQARSAMLWSLVKTIPLCSLSIAEITEKLGKVDGYYLTEKYQTWFVEPHLQLAIDIPYGKIKPQRFFIANDSDILVTFPCD